MNDICYWCGQHIQSGTAIEKGGRTWHAICATTDPLFPKEVEPEPVLDYGWRDGYLDE